MRNVVWEETEYKQLVFLKKDEYKWRERWDYK